MGLSIMSNWLRPATPSVAAAAPLSFVQVYEEHLDFVWRVARRLGVPEASIDDAVQDVFLVVHDRLASFEGRSSLRTWLYGIVRRVARDHRPSKRERPLEEAPEARSESASAHEGLERAEAKRLLHALLDTLDDDKREVFVLAELEEMPMPDVAQAIGINVNTAHARLRAARHQLEEALARLHARQTWRSP